jgi:hypothetical protein
VSSAVAQVVSIRQGGAPSGVNGALPSGRTKDSGTVIVPRTKLQAIAELLDAGDVDTARVMIAGLLDGGSE